MGRTKATLKLCCNAFWRFRHSKGFGIHSPFAFKFVLDVLREKCGYYAYAGIKARRRLVARRLSAKRGVHTRIISLKNAKMLFRIACYFNPRLILQIGSTYGISTSSVLDVSASSWAIVYKGAECYDDMFSEVTAGYRDRIVEAGSVGGAFDLYERSLAEGDVPFLMVNSLDDESEVEECSRRASRILERDGVVVVRNLLVDDKVVRFVRNVTSLLDHGMSFTNGRLIVIVGYRHLPRQRFNLWF